MSQASLKSLLVMLFALCASSALAQMPNPYGAPISLESAKKAVVAAEAHAVRRLTADADAHGVAGVALADDGAFGVDEVAVEGEAADVRDGVLNVLGEGAQVGVGGEEAAGVNDTALPFVAVEIESDERRYLHDGLDLREVRLGLGGLELF